MKAEIYTDGACSGNPGPGGYAAIVRLPGKDEIELSGQERRTTNGRMELLAAERAIDAALANGAAEINLYSDSQYVVKGINEWIISWKKRGWLKADRKPVEHTDLWKQIDAQMQGAKVTAHWVRGHHGHDLNERVNFIAQSLARSLQNVS